MSQELFGGDKELAEEHDAFYIAYGRAMSRWASVEGSLRILYLTSQGILYAAENCDIQEMGRRERSLLAAYYQVVNYRSRLSMIEASVKVLALPSLLLESWKPLLRRLERQSKTRNSLAHFGAVLHQGAPPGRRFFVAEDIANPLVPHMTAKKIFTHELVEIEKLFRSLAEDVAAFEGELQGALLKEHKLRDTHS